MRRTAALLPALVLFVASLSSAQTSPLGTGAGVPPVIRFSGTVAVAPGLVPVTFGLYQEETGGEPLWSEMQALAIDAAGRYTVVLGLTAALPGELFLGGEARWLDVAAEGAAPQPRRLLVSVPYALKAADAETIGGKPLSAFVLAGDKSGVGADGLTYVDRRVLAAGLATDGPPSPLGGSGAAGGAGTANFIGVFTDAATLGNSVVYQTPAGSIGINTTAPAAAFHAVSAASPGTFFDVFSNSLVALPVVYRAARGTPVAPSAVQAHDILGGLAVRGYGATTWSAGRGQVMFKAAENWTDSANGTYLQFTTTPLGGTGWLERIRVAPDGNVGIGTSTPAQRLSVAGTIESTSGGFKFPDGTTQATAAGAVGNPAANNTAVGDGALAATTTGSNNTAIGEQSLAANTAGNQNTAVGRLSLGANTTGGQNAAFGDRSLTANTTGGQNSAFGFESLLANTTGVTNSAFGYQSLRSNSTGSENASFGVSSMDSNTTGGSNAAFGAWSLPTNTTGSFNAAFGASSLARSIVSFENSAFGANTLSFNTTGASNAAFGYRSLGANTTASGNSAFGYQSLAANTTGARNAAFGEHSLEASATAWYNAAFGSYSLTNTTGSSNAAFGASSMNATTTGYSNAAFGRSSLAFNTTGYNNAAFGRSSLLDNTTGSDNAAFGYESLAANTTGSSNTAVGYQASPVSTTATSTTAVGYQALGDLTDGTGNTAVGYLAGANVTTGGYNTVIGYHARVDSTAGGISYATAIGALAIVAQSNAIVLGPAGPGNTVGIGTSTPDDKLQVVGDVKIGTSGTNGCIKNFAGTGILGTCSSDLRLKQNVRPFEPMLDRVARLQPVHFDWQARAFPEYRFGAGLNSGLIAQSVEQIFPELVSTDDRGFKMVNYSELPYLTLQAVKELKAENDALRAQLAALAERLARLENR